MSDAPLICFIDDDEALRRGMSAFLQALGYRVRAFAKAEEYLESELLLQTSCLITDLLIGDINGALLQDLLIGHGYRIPIIFVTAVRDVQITKRLLTRGARGIFHKPFDEKALIECIERAVRESGS